MKTIDLRDYPAIYMNLPRHENKNVSMQIMLQKCGFKEIIREDGVEINNNKIAGCSAAHHKVLSKYKTPFVLFEDDCVIKNYTPFFDIPEDTDALYLGTSTWGRLNSHSGPFVECEKISDKIYRIYNMLSAHAVLYLSEEYKKICERISYHAAYKIEDYQDIGFAEIQKWFNIFAVKAPVFFQTSALDATIKCLNQNHISQLDYNSKYFLPKKLR